MSGMRQNFILRANIIAECKQRDRKTFNFVTEDLASQCKDELNLDVCRGYEQ